VVLADVELDADGNVVKIDNCVCRRLVLSFADFWWHCRPPAKEPAPAPAPEPPTPGPTPGPAPGRAVKVDRVVTRGKLVAGTRNQVAMFGQNLDQVQSVSFGQGITVEGTKAAPDQFVAGVAISNDAKPGPRTISLTDKRNDKVEVAGQIDVEAGAEPGEPVQPRPPSPPVRPTQPDQPVAAPRGKARPRPTAKRSRKKSDEEV